MAVSLIGASDGYNRTASLPTTTAFTFCCWFYRTGTAASFKALFQLNGADFIQLYMDPSHVLTILGPPYTGATVLTTSANAWYFAAVRGQGTGAADLIGSYRATTDTGLTSASQSGGSFTPTGIFVGTDNASEFLDGNMAAIKVWDAVLTDDELLVESHYYRAIRRANLNIESPMFHTGEDEIDYSGNGRDWTVTGTPANADGPPIIWAPRLSRFSAKAAAADVLFAQMMN